MPKATVILRTKNSADRLPAVLKSLFSQDFKDFSLLAIDSESEDETVRLLESISCELYSIQKEEYFPGRVLNFAVRKTKTPLVVFLNSDAPFLAPDCLGKLLFAFDDPKVQAAFGRQVPEPGAKNWVRRDYAASFPAEGSAPYWLPLSLPIAAMRRSAFDEHPFYEAAYGSEDIEWGIFAKSKGWNIAYVPACVVMHSHNYSLRGLYGRRFIEGEADAFIYGTSFNFFDALLQYFKSFYRDAPYFAPLVRFVASYGYYRGFSHGKRRIKKGDTDASFGQKTVLSRYE